MTSAGTAAGIDLCLHLVALDYGADVAATVSRRLRDAAHRSGGQAQYVDTPVVAGARRRDDELLDVGGRANLAAGIVGRRSRPPRRDEPAHAHAPLPAATGIAAGRVAAGRAAPARAAAARDHGRRVERVAQRAGYDTPVAMRAQFAHRLHTSPRAYRRTFRAA